MYLLLGLSVGFLGTLIGAGGGFILVPILLFLFPGLRPEEITAISIFCVAANASSGTLAYFRHKQVHVKAAIAFTLAGLPGAWLGAGFTHLVNRDHFNLIFATLITALGLYICMRRYTEKPVHIVHRWNPSGKAYVIGIFLSFFIGFIASFLGIGGGIIHVPLLVQVLAFPIHLATGTSHFILAITAIVASIEHYSHGDLNFHATFIIYLAIGIIIGAQYGARMSKKVHGGMIMRLLGVALLFVALRIFAQHF